jgi:hypothetical protein
MGPLIRQLPEDSQALACDSMKQKSSRESHVEVTRFWYCPASSTLTLSK